MLRGALGRHYMAMLESTQNVTLKPTESWREALLDTRVMDLFFTVRPTYLLAYLSVDLPTYTSPYIPTYLPSCLFTYLPTYLPTNLCVLTCMHTHQSVYLTAYQSLCVPTHLSVFLPTCPSVCVPTSHQCVCVPTYSHVCLFSFFSVPNCSY